MRHHKHLRPWVWRTIEITLGAAVGIAFLFTWTKVIYCITGFDLLWLLGGIR